MGNFAISAEIKEIFATSRASAGKHIIRAKLAMQGIHVGLYLVAKLMKKQGLISKQPRKRPCNGAVQNKEYPNLLGRQFTPEKGCTVLCGDTTFLKVNGVWHYLAVVMNLANRAIIGWALSPHHDSALVIDALNQAMVVTKPSQTMLFHSDQGSIYGSEAFTHCVKQQGLTQSMSRRGNCWDNAPVERWFRSFKYEWLPKGGYLTFAQALADVAAYVSYYNHQRPHCYHQGLPPVNKVSIGDCGFS